MKILFGSLEAGTRTLEIRLCTLRRARSGAGRGSTLSFTLEPAEPASPALTIGPFLTD